MWITPTLANELLETTLWWLLVIAPCSPHSSSCMLLEEGDDLALYNLARFMCNWIILASLFFKLILYAYEEMSLWANSKELLDLGEN